MTIFKLFVLFEDDLKIYAFFIFNRRCSGDKMLLSKKVQYEVFEIHSWGYMQNAVYLVAAFCALFFISINFNRRFSYLYILI